MANWTIFDSWNAKTAEVMVRGATPPDPTKFQIALLNGLTVTRGMSRATLVAAELSGNGYVRQAYAPTVGSYDTAEKRYELPKVTVTFEAVGASSQWSAVVMFADVGTVNEAPVMFANFPVQTIADGSTQPIEVFWNTFNAGNVVGV